MGLDPYSDTTVGLVRSVGFIVRVKMSRRLACLFVLTLRFVSLRSSLYEA